MPYNLEALGPTAAVVIVVLLFLRYLISQKKIGSQRDEQIMLCVKENSEVIKENSRVLGGVSTVLGQTTDILRDINKR